MHAERGAVHEQVVSIQNFGGEFLVGQSAFFLLTTDEKEGNAEASERIGNGTRCTTRAKNEGTDAGKVFGQQCQQTLREPNPIGIVTVEFIASLGTRHGFDHIDGTDFPRFG